MPDDKLISAALEARRFSEKLQPYGGAMEAAKRPARPLRDALRAINENSAVKQAMEHIARHEEINRAALGPLRELQIAGVSIWTSRGAVK